MKQSSNVFNTAWSTDIHRAMDTPIAFIQEWIKNEFEEFKQEHVPLNGLITVSTFVNNVINTKTIQCTKKEIEFTLLFQLRKRPYEAVFFNEQLIFGGYYSRNELEIISRYRKTKEHLGGKPIMV